MRDHWERWRSTRQRLPGRQRAGMRGGDGRCNASRRAFFGRSGSHATQWNINWLRANCEGGAIWRRRMAIRSYILGLPVHHQ